MNIIFIMPLVCSLNTEVDLCMRPLEIIIYSCLLLVDFLSFVLRTTVFLSFQTYMVREWIILKKEIKKRKKKPLKNWCKCEMDEFLSGEKATS